MNSVTPRVAIVGLGADADQVGRRLDKRARGRTGVVGFIDPQGDEVRVIRSPVMGDLSELERIVGQERVNVIVAASGVLDRDSIRVLAGRCSKMGVRFLQTPFTWRRSQSHPIPAVLHRLDLVDPERMIYTRAARWVKRFVDVGAVLCGGAVLFFPLMLVALAIKLQDGGPVLYVSRRSGQNGAAFGFYKFRSMVAGAEAERDQLENESGGRLFKMRDDPRITPIGRIIRRWSIDELPQLLNVLKGDMNLVGPRPLPMDDLKGIESDSAHWYWFQQRSRVKPGITGLWQVAGRSELPFEAMVDLDVCYIQNWSLWLDFLILFQTIPAVLKGRGAQ